jgi:hypothetical protein
MPIQAAVVLVKNWAAASSTLFDRGGHAPNCPLAIP